MSYLLALIQIDGRGVLGYPWVSQYVDHRNSAGKAFLDEVLSIWTCVVLYVLGWRLGAVQHLVENTPKRANIGVNSVSWYSDSYLGLEVEV